MFSLRAIFNSFVESKGLNGPHKTSFIAMGKTKDVQDGGQAASVNALSAERWSFTCQTVIHVYLNHCCTVTNAVTSPETCFIQ
jgi:hypothetical protein